jgi:predicted amidohydrolase
MTIIHWNRRQFLGTTLTASVVAIGTHATPALGSTSTIHRFLLVQSAALPIDAAHAESDLQRNLERMLQIIEQHASPNDWMAFDDAPLTGHVTAALPATTLALSDSDLKTLAIAATRKKSWVSFGAIRRERDSIIAISPQGKIHEWTMPSRYAPLPLETDMLKPSSVLPIIEFDGHQLALLPVDAKETTLAQCAERGVDIVITMGSGPQCTLAPTHSLSPSLLMHVQAASPWQPPGCHAEGINRSRAINGRGEVIAECPNAGDQLLILDRRS